MLPLMSEALSGLTQQVNFGILNKTQQNYNTVETPKVVGFVQLSLQPMHPQRLAVKPDGQRKWKWLQAWGTQDVPIDNYIQDTQGTQYRVMAKSNWKDTGSDFIEYELVETTSMGRQAP